MLIMNYVLSGLKATSAEAYKGNFTSYLEQHEHTKILQGFRAGCL